MTRIPYYVTAIAAAAFCLLVAPASATHVQCGATITTRTVLDSDVQCAAGEPYGLIIGASDIKLLLNGYTVRGVYDGNVAGIYSSRSGPPPPFPARVSIKGGSIEGFTAGVNAGLDDSVLHNLNFRNTGTAAFLAGDRNTLTKNVVREVREGGNVGFGLYAYGNDSYVWGNRYAPTEIVDGTGVGTAIYVEGVRSYVVNNQIECMLPGCGSAHAAIYVGGGNARVSLNTVHGDYSWGLSVVSPGAHITLNESIGNFRGLEVAGDERTSVGRNVTNNCGPNCDQFGYGIVISGGPGVTVRNNTANGNSGYGIDAVEGTIDGGGNTASGNGQGSTPQCVNVQCSSP